MKKYSRLILVSLLMIFAAPAWSAAVVQVWSCEMEDGTSEDTLNAAASKWLKAAKGMKGGEEMEANLFFPVAVDKTGEIDLLFLIRTPSFEAWGAFWDGYAGSAAEAVDKENQDFVVCPDSALWENVVVE